MIKSLLISYGHNFIMHITIYEILLENNLPTSIDAIDAIYTYIHLIDWPNTDMILIFYGTINHKNGLNGDLIQVSNVSVDSHTINIRKPRMQIMCCS